MFCNQCGESNNQNSKFCASCGARLTQADEPTIQKNPTFLDQSQKYASFWIRAFAAIIDGAIILVIIRLLTPLLGYALIASMPDIYTDSQIYSIGKGVGFINVLLIPWLWFAIQVSSKWQATLGKKMLGIKVTDENGERIGFGKATWRFGLKLLSISILFVGFLMVAFTRNNQGLHDKIAGTIVINEKAVV